MVTIETIENNILQTDFCNTEHRKENIGKCFGTSLVALHPVLLWRAKEPEEQHGMPRSARIITWRVLALPGAGDWGS